MSLLKFIQSPGLSFTSSNHFIVFKALVRPLEKSQTSGKQEMSNE